MAKRRGFMDGYRTYNPEVEGYGNATEWRAAFNATMGTDEARRVMGDETPEAVLGVDRGAAWTVIVKAYRARLVECHPDRCAIHGLPVDVATERAKRITAAFTLLKDRYGKK